MRPCAFVSCDRFPCSDVRRECYSVPKIDLDPSRVKLVLISEAAPSDAVDGYYAGGSSLFERTTVAAFKDAGADVDSIADVLALGVYLTTAVKCGKTGYGLATATIGECSLLLERELALFPDARAWLLMGDVAIKAANMIAAHSGEKRPIPAGPTYKIRGGVFVYRSRRLLPSYLQAGPSFYIEKSKRAMIAQDIASALALVERGS